MHNGALTGRASLDSWYRNKVKYIDAASGWQCRLLLSDVAYDVDCELALDAAFRAYVELAVDARRLRAVGVTALADLRMRDRLRDALRRRVIDIAPIDLVDQLAAPSAPHAAAQWLDAADALRSLPFQDAAAVLLGAAGFSSAEIAARLGVSSASARQRVSRGRRRLSQRAGSFGEEDQRQAPDLPLRLSLTSGRR